MTVVYVNYIQYSKIPFKLHIVPYPTDSPSACDRLTIHGQFVTVVYVNYIQYSKIPFKLHIVPYPTDSPSWSVCDSSIRKLYTVQ